MAAIGAGAYLVLSYARSRSHVEDVAAEVFEQIGFNYKDIQTSKKRPPEKLTFDKWLKKNAFQNPESRISGEKMRELKIAYSVYAKLKK